jgi:hypothetical protein
VNHVSFLQIYVMLPIINNGIFVIIINQYKIKCNKMKLFTKDTFGYLFQAAVIILLFTYSPAASNNEAKEGLYQKILVVNKPNTNLLITTKSGKKQIEPAVFNYIFKTKLTADKAVKPGENNFIDYNTGGQLTEPFSIGFPQIVLK